MQNRSKKFIRKTPPPLTRARLEALALRYISRYAATRGMLLRVLARHIQKAVIADASFEKDAARGWAETIADTYEQRGWIDDEARARSLLESAKIKGVSRQRLHMHMQKKGLGAALISETLGTLQDEDDEKAARLFAQKKKLGPYRQKRAEDENAFRKDLARLCRAGFSPAAARKALQGAED